MFRLLYVTVFAALIPFVSLSSVADPVDPTPVVIGGILHGFINVNIEGTLYDVTFQNGPCNGLYGDNCDVFTFTDSSAASMVLLALLQTLPGFRDSPELIAGCDRLDVCHLATAQSFGVTFPDLVDVTRAIIFGNDFSGFVDSFAAVTGWTTPFDFDNSGSWTNVTYTLSSVPLPGALLLFGSALIGLLGLGRRRGAAKN